MRHTSSCLTKQMIHYQRMLVVLLFIQKCIILIHSMALNRKRTMSQTNLQFL